MTGAQKTTAAIAAGFLLADLGILAKGIDSSPGILMGIEIGLISAQFGLGAAWVVLGGFASWWWRLMICVVGGALLSGLFLISWNAIEGTIFIGVDVTQALLTISVLSAMRWSGFDLRSVDGTGAGCDDATYRTQFSIRDVLALTTFVAAASAACGYLTPTSGGILDASMIFIYLMFGGSYAVAMLFTLMSLRWV
jgi:hypothetical protein